MSRCLTPGARLDELRSSLLPSGTEVDGIRRNVGGIGQRFVLALLILAVLWPTASFANEPAKRVADVPFRTDGANEHLPWYQLRPGEFPPKGSEHRVSGDLLEADFIHRRGQFRNSATGELSNFSLPPYGSVMFLNAEGDLRDPPLGTRFTFFLYQDAAGAFTQAASLWDDFSLLAAEGLSYRLDATKFDQGKLLVTKHRSALDAADLGTAELAVNQRTRVWKGDQPAKLSDLAAGDELLVNFTAGEFTAGGPNRPAQCCDIWIGAETHKLVSERQRKQHTAFLKQRGMPAWIDRVDGKRLTITLFGEPAGLAALMKDEGIDPSRWAAEHRSVDVVVANEELRTYNPPVDRQHSSVQEIQSLPVDVHGSSGMRWVLEPRLLLEGFRKGHIVRVFAHPSWKVDDMPFGENIYTEDPDAKQEVDEPLQYPFRTDFANEHLPWHELRPGVFPPLKSHHLATGELTKIDALHRSGQFRAEGAGELVEFTLPPFGSVLYLNSEAELADIPLGTRLAFYLHPDARGAFTKASVVMDDFTWLASEKRTLRVEAVLVDQRKLILGAQHAPVKNYHGDMVSPPSLGHAEFAVDANTRVWKLDQPIQLSELAVGDELLLNTTGRTTTSRGRCTDIWVGAETHKLVAERGLAKHNALVKERGAPAWIDSVDGKNFTITFFAAHRKEFQALLGGDPWGKGVHAILVDEELNPLSGGVDKFGFKNHLPEGTTGGTYGCSGVRWVLETGQPADGYQPGRLVRVFQHDWPVKTLADDKPPAER